MKSLEKLALAIITFIVLVSYSSFAGGYAFYKCYKWLVIPNITQAPPLNYYACVALYLFINIFFKGEGRIDRKTIMGEYTEKNILYYPLIISKPWFYLLIGWLIKLFLS